MPRCEFSGEGTVPITLCQGSSRFTLALGDGALVSKISLKPGEFGCGDSHSHVVVGRNMHHG